MSEVACFCEIGYECIGCARTRTGLRDISPSLSAALNVLATPNTPTDPADETRDEHAAEWLADVADSGDLA